MVAGGQQRRVGWIPAAADAIRERRQEQVPMYRGRKVACHLVPQQGNCSRPEERPSVRGATIPGGAGQGRRKDPMVPQLGEHI